ncbi:hypothetical protein F5Y16DRAFT_125299 [Xylariaceae sp. FL0255]|nr:hypothetical protein F5Y16DRAFT_125299 [Xylariaceae sp. FL0255]
MEPRQSLGYQTTVFRAQPTEGSQRKIQKRNRPPVSCLLCRTRKVKCDRQQPCERCVKSGEASFCEYAPRAARKPRGPDSRLSVESHPKQEGVSRPVLQVRLQKLEELVNGLVTAGTFPEYSLHTPSSSDHRTELDTRSDLSSPPSLGAPTSLPLGGTTRTGDGTYVGGTHWASILESIHDIQGILDAEAELPSPPSPQPINSHWPVQQSQDFVFGKGVMITHEEAMARLPPQHQTDHLVLQYFRNRFLAAPYIHTNKFKREYDSFWRDPTSVSLLWISCLASILEISSATVASKDQVTMSELATPGQLSSLAVDCLLAGDYLSAKPYSVEALLLHGFVELKISGGITSVLWSKFGLTARIAQRMGYHRDPKYLSNVTPFEGELRRRAWFFIEVFDCLHSFAMGVPPIIRDDECDTESPGNLYDSDFDENMMVLPPSRPVTEPTSTLYLCIKSKLCRILRRVIRMSLSIHPPSYDEVLKVNDELIEYHNQVPASLQIKPVRSYSFTEQSFDIMHRLMLEMMYLKSVCVLHRPYLNREKDNPRCEVSRNACREAALKIMDIHAEYEEESRPGGRLYEDKGMLASLTLHDFLIASMVICLDLTENLPSSAADKSRKLKALGASYKIWSERKHTDPEAAHATRVVGAILRKVSIQDHPHARPSPLPPPPEVRGGSLASLLNNDIQPAPVLPNLYDQSSLIPAMDFSLDLGSVNHMDSILKDANMVDWSIIDHILLERPDNSYRPVQM